MRTMLVTCCLFLVVSAACAEDYLSKNFEDISTNEMLYVRGLVSKVSPETMQVWVRPPKAKLIQLNLQPNSVLEGFGALGELKVKDQVKVWYATDKDENRVIKIVKLLDLGC